MAGSRYLLWLYSIQLRSRVLFDMAKIQGKEPVEGTYSEGHGEAQVEEVIVPYLVRLCR